MCLFRHSWLVVHVSPPGSQGSPHLAFGQFPTVRRREIDVATPRQFRFGQFAPKAPRFRLNEAEPSSQIKFHEAARTARRMFAGVGGGAKGDFAYSGWGRCRRQFLFSFYIFLSSL